MKRYGNFMKCAWASWRKPSLLSWRIRSSRQLSFEDRFAMLVDAEWSARKSNRLTRLIRNAGYADPAACVENIEYHPE